MNLQSTRTLANGIEMPIFGLGVYKMTDTQETIEAITKALQVGYRAIDTASLYYMRSKSEKRFVIQVSHGKIYL